MLVQMQFLIQLVLPGESRDFAFLTRSWMMLMKLVLDCGHSMCKSGCFRVLYIVFSTSYYLCMTFWRKVYAFIPEVVKNFVYNSSKLFYFVLVYGQLINNVVIVSGEQRRDSAIHIHVSILSSTPLPSRLPHNTEQSSLSYTVGPCYLFILNMTVCTSPSQTP